MKEIKLTRGLKAMVDDEDFAKLNSVKWCAHSAGYAYRTGGQLMHRIIMNAPDNLHIDHINGNRLDNRKCNLRLCTRSQNALNKNKYCGRGPYIGVHFTKRTGKYEAYIKFFGKKDTSRPFLYS